MLQAMRKNGIRLSLFALFSTAAVVLTHVQTDSQIHLQQQNKLNQLLGQMLPVGSYNNALAKSCYEVSSPLLGTADAHKVYVAKQNDQIVGYILESTAPNGYSGRIQLLAGITAENSIYRVEVLEHHETPGLGDKIERARSSWLDGFMNKNLKNQWAVKKDNGEFDSFTGATITPRAIVNQLHNTLLFVEQNRMTIQQSNLCKGE